MNGYGPVNTAFSFRATDNVLIFKKNIETGVRYLYTRCMIALVWGRS